MLRRDRSEGQALVEFALILPIFLLIVFGVLDVGRLVYTNSVLSQAAREGARLAAAEASWIGVTAPSCRTLAEIETTHPGGHVCPVDVPTFKANVTDAVNRMTAAVGSISAVHLSCNSGDLLLDPVPTSPWTEASGGNGCKDGAGNAIASSGDLVSVRVEYTYQLFTPIINSFLASVPLSGSATMIIN